MNFALFVFALFVVGLIVAVGLDIVDNIQAAMRARERERSNQEFLTALKDGTLDEYLKASRAKQSRHTLHSWQNSTQTSRKQTQEDARWTEGEYGLYPEEEDLL